MARLGRLGFLGIGVVFHLVYLWSIFDIYFVSPIVHGMREFHVDAAAPAKRLFLVVGDGLRADKCFQQHRDPDDYSTTRHLAPFVRSKVLNDATFGVSHTRVPTESRPGHVALIAGLYEDVSAVTTGWKLNPVNFDSVFNRSRHTWSWGSPDILTMFEHGASDRSRVDAFTYDEEMEDFTQDATNLDIWVFNRVKGLFEEAGRNQTLNKMMREDKLVFFLHLLGLDTTGHAYRPYSDEYLRNIKVVDKGLAEVHKLVEDFYGDGKTAWVFTADHGMSDFGSHGDGHPDNTRTPLVAWGAGVKKPVRTSDAIGHEDGFSGEWGLDRVKRNDVAQADVAALMAYLVGLSFPSNSVGELPLEYLDATDDVKAKAAWTNMREILEIYIVKEEQKKSATIRYKPYGPLADLEERFVEIESLIAKGSYPVAIDRSLELLKLGLEGLRYMQTYDWLFLRTLVTLGYLGWIAFAITSVIDSFVLHESILPKRTTASTVAFSSILVGLYAILAIQHSRATYYAYAFFPVLFWEEVFVRREMVSKGVKELVHDGPGAYMKLVLGSLAGVLFLEAMVQGYFQREVFTGCFLLAVGWPFVYGMDFVKKNAPLAAAWGLLCIFMSTFTLLPAVKIESEAQILFGGSLMFTMGALYLFLEQKKRGDKAITAGWNTVGRSIMGVQVGLISLAMYVTSGSVRSLQAKQGLPLGNQIVGWLVLVASLSIPFLGHSLAPNPHYMHRLIVLFLSFSPTFIILTICYEGLFYVAFSTLLVCWVEIEHRLHLSFPPTSSSSSSTHQHRALTLSDVRISLFFLFLIQVAFFGTGNVASISSFSLDAVYRLIPIFNPFTMGALLMFKLMIPFAVISANLGILNRKLGVAPSALFMVVSAISDVLTLNFFWMVKDEGSWLEIGSTISHFFIGGLLGVFVSVLEVGAGVLVGGVEVEKAMVKENGEEKK